MRVDWMVLIALLVGQGAQAKCQSDLPVGSRLLARKTISGWIEQGQEKEGYEGCAYGRVLVFSDRTGVMCSSYLYQYAYNPSAEIWAIPSGLQLCVEGQEMQVQQVR